MSKKNDGWEKYYESDLREKEFRCEKAFDKWRVYRDWYRSFPGNIKAYDSYLSGYLASWEHWLHKEVIKAAFAVVKIKGHLYFTNDKDEEDFAFDVSRFTQNANSYKEFWEQFDKAYDERARFPF